MLIIVGAGYLGILEDGKGFHFILSTLCMFEKFQSKVKKNRKERTDNFYTE